MLFERLVSARNKSLEFYTLINLIAIHINQPPLPPQHKDYKRLVGLMPEVHSLFLALQKQITYMVKNLTSDIKILQTINKYTGIVLRNSLPTKIMTISSTELAWQTAQEHNRSSQLLKMLCTFEF